ncbi:GGDEF domain-containing protein [Alicyclobacillus sp. ALC3]|uniref:GGDEF domain-containing protein n=1 Tax=Alicyclobacillus sp. ALC3 TaxID=2796143 RepID=UPI0023793709|nr:GGDEF domain-containing protein [Alicyclobacillus sp. ALC3]WDL98582.1 GGDEF domain-containing protein [Alicyclobacillus sp. ALC3]
MDRLDLLLSASRQWTTLARGSHVAQAAIQFLREHFEIDAGFFIFERRPRQNGIDYLKSRKRMFYQWGLEASDDEIRYAIRGSKHFTEYIHSRAWYSTNELPPAWADIVQNSGIMQAGLWAVHFDDAPVGVFALGRRTISPDDSKELSRCMELISVFLEMVLQRRVAEGLSVHDPLTGLFNRRGFLTQFDEIVSAHDDSLTLCVLDVDRFKLVNDQSGHQAGDDLLMKAGDILSRHTKECGGICARFGGDEFVILTRSGSLDVDATAEAACGWFLDEGIPMSVGCAVIGIDGYDFDSCYYVADKRLYEMKIAHTRSN